MLGTIRATAASRSSVRAFSTSSSRRHDVSKLILVGRLGKAPEVRTSKSDNEYVSYSVATTNYPPPPANPDGSRRPSTATWHNIMSFNPAANSFLKTLEKGARVWVEANFELREPEPSADSTTPQGQRQIFLRHESIRVVGSRPNKVDENATEY